MLRTEPPGESRPEVIAEITSRGRTLLCEVRYEPLASWFVVLLPDGAGELRIACELVERIARNGAGA